MCCGICVVLYRHLEIVLQFIAGVKKGAAGGKKHNFFALMILLFLIYDGIRQGPELSKTFFKFNIFMIYVLLRVIIYI